MPNVADANRPETIATDVSLENTPAQVQDAPGATPLLDTIGAVANTKIEVIQAKCGDGHATWATFRSPFKSGVNEDTVATFNLSEKRGVLLVADGLGGHRDGHLASQMIKSRIAKATRHLTKPSRNHLLSKIVPVPTEVSGTKNPELRTIILDEIERTNQRLLRSRTGSATTLALAETNGRRIRTYHIGDSEILIFSQRGRLKFSTVSHSPIGYAVESGLITEEQALFHPDRHLVSNVIGSEQMSVELGTWVTLSPRDTVLLASDGLFDNLMQFEIIEHLRKGKLADGVLELATLARQRMLLPDSDAPSKPDDLSIMAYRCV